MVKCPNCHVWDLKENDFYCGFCGHVFFKVEVDEIIRVYLGRDKEACELPIELRNTGALQASLSFSLKEYRPSYLGISPPASEIDIAPNQSKTIRVPIDFSGGGIKMARVVIEASSRGWNKAITGYVFQQPEFGKDSREIKIMADSEDFCQIDFPLEIRSTPEVYLQKVEIVKSKGEISTQNGCGLIKTDYAQEQSGKGTPSFTYPVSLTLPPRYEGRLGFNFFFQGLDAVEFEADIVRQEVPKVALFHYVDIGGAVKKDFGWYIEVVANIGVEEDRKVVLRNDSNYKITFAKLGSIVTNARLEIKVVNPITSFTLEPGKERELLLTVKLKSEIAGDRFCHEQFSLHTSIDALDEKDYVIGPLQVTVEVNPLDKMESWIALDFGTSSSTACVEKELINLEQEEKIIYSNILFQDPTRNSGLPYSWMIGAAAKARASAEATRLIRSVKTKLWKNEPIKVKLTQEAINVLPTEAAQRIFSELLNEIQKRAKGRPDKLILSVPTRFTTNERDRLVKACKESFGLTHIRLVDESVAVGLFYIQGGGRRDFPNAQYSLMTLDFGAGTTDISFFLVQNQGGEPKKIEIKGAWGDPRLGGDNITNRIKNVLVSKLPGRGRTPIPHDGGDEQLEDLAEDAKILVSEIDNWIREKQITSVIAKQSKKLAKKFVGEKIDPTQLQFQSVATNLLGGSAWDSDAAIGRLAKVIEKREVEVPYEGTTLILSFAEVFGIYQAALKDLLGGLERCMKRISLEAIDVVLLAGQSCKISRMKEWIKHASFEKIDFVKDSSGKVLLKEAVVRGASFYVDVINEGGIQLLGKNMIWRRLGLIKANIFQELLPYDAKLNTEKVFSVFRDLQPSLKIYENLDLDGDAAKQCSPYNEYNYPESVPDQKNLECKLIYSNEGKIEVLCRDSEQWIQLQPKYGN